jgi:hypothetical protein
MVSAEGPYKTKHASSWSRYATMQREPSGVDSPGSQPLANASMMMMSFSCSCRNKIGAELHIYLEEGVYYCSTYYGTREEPGTLTQGGALFSLVPLVWESNPKLQGGW